jgi:hypothetical protein
MKEINNLLILLFILITIVLLWKFTDFGKGKKTVQKNIECFMSPGEAESISGNVEQDDGSCKNPMDPEYVGKFSKTCCENDLPGCICKLDKYKNCKADYDKCFEEKGKEFLEVRKRKEKNIKDVENDISVLEEEIKTQKSPLIIQPIKQKIDDKKKLLTVMQEELEIEPEIPPGIKKQCQNEFGQCAKSKININKTNKTYNEDKFEILPMKKRGPDAEKICEMSLNSKDDIAYCINYCDGMKDCQGGIYNQNTGMCELYNKPLVDKAEGARNADMFNVNFIRKGNGNGTNGASNNNEGFKNRNTNNNTITSTNTNTNTKTRNKEIENILDKVEKKKTGDKTCKATFNNNIKQLKESHKFTKLKLKSNIEPEYGTQVCSRHNISFDKCKDECLLNDECDYLMYGSPVDSSGLDNTQYYSGGNKCVLYSGAPTLEGDSVSLAKVDSGKGYSYYIKRLMSYDERVGL